MTAVMLSREDLLCALNVIPDLDAIYQGETSLFQAHTEKSAVLAQIELIAAGWQLTDATSDFKGANFVMVFERESGPSTDTVYLGYIVEAEPAPKLVMMYRKRDVLMHYTDFGTYVYHRFERLASRMTFEFARKFPGARSFWVPVFPGTPIVKIELP